MAMENMKVSTCESDRDGEEVLLTLPKNRSVHFSPEVVSPTSSPTFRCALQGFQSPSDRFFDPKTPAAGKKGLSFFGRMELTDHVLEAPETKFCTQGQLALQVPSSPQVQTAPLVNLPPQEPSPQQISSSPQMSFPPQFQPTQLGCPQRQAELMQNYLCAVAAVQQSLLAQHSLVAQPALAAQQSLVVQQAVAAVALTAEEQQQQQQQQQQLRNQIPCMHGSQAPFPSTANDNTTQGSCGSHQALHTKCASKVPYPVPAKVFVDLSQLRELATH